jgi:hypothetical protein
VADAKKNYVASAAQTGAYVNIAIIYLQPKYKSTENLKFDYARPAKS